MTLLEKLYTPYKLKRVERQGKVGQRNETTAEHVFSSITLAQYFLKKYPDINELKVLKLIVYHDYGEIHAGDTGVLNTKERAQKALLEARAFCQLEKELPEEIAKDMKEAWEEYEENKTREAQFVHAIDALDPILHSIYQPEEWKANGFTEKKLRTVKEPRLREFPQLMEFFEELVTELRKRNIIPKE